MLQCAFTSKKWICWQVPWDSSCFERAKKCIGKTPFRQHWNKAVASIAQPRLGTGFRWIPWPQRGGHHWFLFHWVKPLTNWEEHQVRKIGFSWTILKVYICFFDCIQNYSKGFDQAAMAATDPLWRGLTRTEFFDFKPLVLYWIGELFY